MYLDGLIGHFETFTSVVVVSYYQRFTDWRDVSLIWKKFATEKVLYLIMFHLILSN